MNTRHKNMGRTTGRDDVYFFMDIPQSIKFVVTTPAVGAHFGTTLHDLTNEWYQAFRRKIGYALHSYAPVPNRLMDFKCNNNDTFSFGPSASFSAFAFTAYKGLIYLYNAMKLVAAGPHHGSSHFMKPTPGCLVASKSKYSFETQSVSTEFLAGDVPNGLEPQPKWFSRPVEYRPCKDRCLLFAFGTTNQPFCHSPTFCSIALGASETIRPTKLLKIFYAFLFCRKPLIKFLHGPRVVHTAYRICLKLAHGQLISQGQRNG